MKKTLLTAKNVCKSFAHEGGQIHVCNHVNLELYEGDFTVIMGTSGSGKSTLLYVLSGMDKATAGEVLYQGSDLTAMKEKQLAALRKQDFGFIFQQMHLVSNLTIFENVAVAGYLESSKTAGTNGTFTGKESSAVTGFRRTTAALCDCKSRNPHAEAVICR